jgi:hypothetical protein
VVTGRRGSDMLKIIPSAFGLSLKEIESIGVVTAFRRPLKARIYFPVIADGPGASWLRPDDGVNIPRFYVFFSLSRTDSKAALTA